MPTITNPELIDREHEALKCQADPRDHLLGIQRPFSRPCPDCDGSGFVDELPCWEASRCDGDYFDPVGQVCGVVHGTGSPQTQLVCPACLEGETE